MKPTPKGWPRMCASVYYDDASAAIDWLCRAFGFEVRLKVEGEGGRIEHSELTFGEAVVMVSPIKPEKSYNESFVSPRQVSGKNTQTLCIFVDDADQHCARAREAGAVIGMEPETHDYGDDFWVDRTYQATDPEGHCWWFLQRLRDPSSRA
jgi:uncharacterized glyoxalase superfamily protein PhnB